MSYKQNNIGIYFSREEAKEMLRRFGDAIRDGQYKKKLEYKVYRALRDNAHGFYVNEDNATYELFLTDGTTEIMTDINGHRTFINQKGDVWLTDIEKSSDFGRFLFDNYLVYHSDYYLHKEKREMPEVKSITSECYYNADNDKLHYWDYSDNTISNNASLIYDTRTNTVDSYDGLLTTVSLADNWGNSRTLEELVDERIDKKLNKNKNEEEKEDMMKGFNFDFGPCTGDNVRMSMYGLAVKNGNGEWVSYNPSTKQIVNVDILNFDGRKFMFKMPVAIKDIAVGDIIVHNKVPMFVIGVGEENGAVIAVDVRAGEEKKILPTTSPFGFNFVTKVVSMFTAFEKTPTPDAPFGNFLPFMLMSEDGNADIDPLMVMMMMQNGGVNAFSNPMMMYFLCGDKMKDNMFPLMFMMNQTAPAAVPASK